MLPSGVGSADYGLEKTLVNTWLKGALESVFTKEVILTFHSKAEDLKLSSPRGARLRYADAIENTRGDEVIKSITL